MHITERSGNQTKTSMEALALALALALKTVCVLAADESLGPSLNANLSETGISRNSFQKSIPCKYSSERLREDGQQTWICLALLHAVPSDALLGEL